MKKAWRENLKVANQCNSIINEEAFSVMAMKYDQCEA